MVWVSLSFPYRLKLRWIITRTDYSYRIGWKTLRSSYRISREPDGLITNCVTC